MCLAFAYTFGPVAPSKNFTLVMGYSAAHLCALLPKYLACRCEFGKLEIPTPAGHLQSHDGLHGSRQRRATDLPPGRGR